jgi:cytosine/adenosine deaminase-related metal-dependent hydrolase
LIENTRIVAIREDCDASVPSLDLSGYLLLPGLLNAHDHLEFGLFTPLGRREDEPPYRNLPEWAREIHQVHSGIIERYRQIPKTTHLWWGAIRNLICGVTTVCHHNPLYAELTLSDFPVRVLSGLAWSHSLSFDPNLAQKFRDAPRNQPFILHAAEGIDEESQSEIARLDRMHALNDRTVLVHGLACTASEVNLINRRGASLVVCPTSNRFLFARTLSRQLLASVERLALGSDSPVTAKGDLLDEVHYLNDIVGLDPNTIYKLVTSSAAEMLSLNDGQGQLLESGIADLIAVRSQQITPAHVLSTLNIDEVEFVLLGGRVQLASPALYAKLPQSFQAGLSPLDVAGCKRWIRAPLRDLFDAAEDLLDQGALQIGGRKVRHLESI